MTHPTLIITGASRGLGAAAARAAAHMPLYFPRRGAERGRGANLVLAARSAGALQTLSREIRSSGEVGIEPGGVLLVVADVGREEDCRPSSGARWTPSTASTG